MDPTLEQQAVLDCDSSLVVLARPGSGKTFTLARLIQNVLPTLSDHKGIIAISFTNKASKELENRALVTGLSAKKSFFGTIDSFSIQEIISPFFPHFISLPIPDEIVTCKIKDVRHLLVDVDAFEKNCRIKDQEVGEEFIQSCSDLYSRGFRVLEACPKIAMYLVSKSVECQNYFRSRYSHVIIDEYQDSGWEQHTLFLKLKSLGLRAIAVGDIDQSIYYFTQKDPKYMKALASNPDFRSFPLTKNQRCHPSISNYSLSLISTNPQHLQTNEKRVWKTIVTGSQKKIAEWIRLKIYSMEARKIISKRKDVGILCRNRVTASLIEANIGIPIKYFSDSDLDVDNTPASLIFKNLLLTLHENEMTSLDFVRSYFHEDLNTKRYRKILRMVRDLKVKFKTLGRASLTPADFENICKEINPHPIENETMDILTRTISDSRLFNAFMPAQVTEVQLMTLHKAKGLEFDVVFHLDLYEHVIPSREATQGDAIAREQDINLHYVGITRARNYCVLVTSTQRLDRNDVVTTSTASSFFSINGLEKLRGEF